MNAHPSNRYERLRIKKIKNFEKDRARGIRPAAVTEEDDLRSSKERLEDVVREFTIRKTPYQEEPLA